MKALIIGVTLLLSGVGVHQIVNNDSSAPAKHVDPFVTDIQERSGFVYNAVSEAVNQQGKQGTIRYKQTCEDSLSFIQKERLDTNTNYNSLSPEHKLLVQKYRAYLKEAANVVIVSSSGEKADISKLDEAKAALF